MDNNSIRQLCFGIFLELLRQTPSKLTTIDQAVQLAMDQSISLAFQLDAKIQHHQKKLVDLEKEIYNCIKHSSNYDITQSITERGWYKLGVLIEKYYYIEVQYDPSSLRFEMYYPQLNEKREVGGMALGESGIYTEKHSFTKKWKEFIPVVDKVYQDSASLELGE